MPDKFIGFALCEKFGSAFKFRKYAISGDRTFNELSASGRDVMDDEV
jgi:hypothetical protein